METNKNYSTEEYLAAKKAVEERIGFYIHLTVYICVNAYFVFINLKNGGYFWAVWPMAGWGIGLAFHGLGVFGFFNNKAWKDRQIQREIERMRRHSGKF